MKNTPWSEEIWREIDKFPKDHKFFWHKHIYIYSQNTRLWRRMEVSEVILCFR